MTRGKFILITSTICIIIGLGGYYLYKKYTAPNTAPGATTGTKDFSLYDQLFPSKTSTETTPSTTNNTTPNQEKNTVSTRIHQISYRPVAGYGLFSKGVERLISDAQTNGKPKTTTDYVPTVRYVDQETGIVYEQDSKHIESRISNTTIPNTYEAIFSPNGTNIIYRFLDKDQQTILTYIAQLLPKTSDATPDLSGSFTYQNIKNITLSTDGSSYVYLRNKSVGVDVVSTNFTTKKETVLFSSPLSEWVLDTTNKALNLTTKPSGTLPGYSYNIDLPTTVYSKTLSGLGLTEKTTPDGIYKLYSTTTNNVPGLFIMYTKNGSIYKTGLQTLSEKCTYSADLYYCAVPKNSTANTYPDAWYQGSVSFNDGLWLIDLKNQKLTFIEQLQNNESGIDATNLQLSNDNKTLYFVDKKTSLLWAYDL